MTETEKKVNTKRVLIWSVAGALILFGSMVYFDQKVQTADAEVTNTLRYGY